MKTDLAQCWIGLSLVDGDIQSSYTKAYSLIGDLRDACLLENWGNWYGFVKVHDVIRDMALWISCGCGENNNKWFVRAKVSIEENFTIPWSKAEYISLMLNEMRKLPPFGLDRCPMELRMLCLQNNYFDGSIAETIKNFTSLTYLDMRTNLLKNIPDELCSLVNLEYLDLSHNPDIYQLPYCFRNLIKLKFVYLQCTDIRIIPDGIISNLKALQVIDLRSWRAYHGAGSLNYNPTIFQEFGTLDQLKAVGIEADGFMEYESLRDATNLPIRSLILGNLKETHAFCLSDILSAGFAQCTLYDLEIIQSNMEQITVRQEPNYRFRTLTKLSLWFLENLKEITWIGQFPAYVFSRLTCLDVNSCSKLEHLSWVMYLPCLEQLEARFCKNMKEAFPRMGHHGEIMSMDQENHPRTFGCLKHLCLSDNVKLLTICDPDVTFPSLEQLVLTKSPGLIRLPFQTHNLPLKLQELRFDNVECWDILECEDGVKSFLQPALNFDYENEVS
jgi:disease resistance protein RPS2